MVNGLAKRTYDICSEYVKSNGRYFFRKQVLALEKHYTQTSLAVVHIIPNVKIPVRRKYQNTKGQIQASQIFEKWLSTMKGMEFTFFILEY